MKLLLDTHYVLSLLKKEIPQRFPELAAAMAEHSTMSLVSVISLWEIAIKTRLGKLDSVVPLSEIPRNVEIYGAAILDINRHHAIADLDPEPATRDPFDRLLLAQCKVEGLQFVTFDRSLVNHPLAWSPAA